MKAPIRDGGTARVQFIGLTAVRRPGSGQGRACPPPRPTGAQMSRTDLPPTFKQLRYLRTLAGRAGQTFATPRTRQPRSVGSSVSARLGSPSRSCRRSRPLAPISPEDQFLTLRCVVRTVSIIDSAGFVDSSVRLSLPLI